MKLTEKKLRKIVREEITALAERVNVNTREYVNSHGKEPKGRGLWMIEIDGEQFEFPHMSYAEAKKAATKKAKEMNAREIKILP